MKKDTAFCESQKKIKRVDAHKHIKFPIPKPSDILMPNIPSVYLRLKGLYNVLKDLKWLKTKVSSTMPLSDPQTRAQAAKKRQENGSKLRWVTQYVLYFLDIITDRNYSVSCQELSVEETKQLTQQCRKKNTTVGVAVTNALQFAQAQLFQQLKGVKVCTWASVPTSIQVDSIGDCSGKDS
jgi:hypothetical protein